MCANVNRVKFVYSSILDNYDQVTAHLITFEWCVLFTAPVESLHSDTGINMVNGLSLDIESDVLLSWSQVI